MLLWEDLEEDELLRKSGGEEEDVEEEKDEVRLYCACLRRFGRSCLYDFVGEYCGSGEFR